jgi:plastocyanin
VKPVPTARIEGTLIIPSELTITAGSELVFVNVDGGTHTIQADDGTAFAPFGGAEFAAKGARHRVKFDKPGDYGIHCADHGGAGTGMHATVHVEK